jgi:hypothetical protein
MVIGRLNRASAVAGSAVHGAHPPYSLEVNAKAKSDGIESGPRVDMSVAPAYKSWCADGIQVDSLRDIAEIGIPVLNSGLHWSEESGL